ncbi:hypothetical protein RhiXN_04693 [Rhizoctonia solani]|uniref:Uncharacterized protein n=1 Tax=Rhizoctonia solani TaxID=456999 RepID=A0A8H8SSD5_9AGAM|nr:uncharacterized protein RhiXN_04693 [Rhizoctonia solani]QRW16691.1 hypothetical protein RhiXN_04693 [Rhizoctonia solani]
MSRIRPDRLPGASYAGSNALVVAQRKVLGLKDPFNITFDEGNDSQPMTKWYNDHKDNPYVQTLQLRKETSGPFYHEFVVFRLRAGTYWRIDRRQLPDEKKPLDSAFGDGVTAQDTIEQVSSLDGVMHGRSSCMVELEFKVQVHIGLVLRACRSIQKHARRYTLQKHNCYFFAQALTLCVACGASDWAGVGEQASVYMPRIQTTQSTHPPNLEQSKRKGPWMSPNGPFTDFCKEFDLENEARLANFKWNPTDIFTHDWEKLSRLSRVLIHTSPLLRHADHCKFCSESQTVHRQRSLGGEVDRLKNELVEYWNRVFREILEKSYLANHRRLVSSGVWSLVSQNVADKDCKQVVENSIEEVRERWGEYAKGRVDKLFGNVEDLLDPMEICDAWYPNPDEWKLTWTCKDGGPVQAAMDEWQKEIRAFVESEISHLEAALEHQTIQAGLKAQEAAMRARLISFDQSMAIKILVAQREGDLIVPEGAAPADQRTVMSGKTKRSGKTMRTINTVLTKGAILLKNKMLRFFDEKTDRGVDQIARRSR